MGEPLGVAALTVFEMRPVDESPNTVSHTVKWSRFGAIARDRCRELFILFSMRYVWFAIDRETPRRTPGHSHSIVPGGFEVTS
jgi:hypothetical protein